jgi:hypothetical protein
MNYGRRGKYMQPSDCAIYAVCIPGETVRYSSRAPLIPIMGGACTLPQEEREDLRHKGYVFDDEGQSFLSPLNSRFGELSCIQWVVNNAEQLNIGNAQYRRNWVEPSSKWYDENTLYVPEFATFSCSLEQQFYGGHSAFDAPLITKTLAASGKWLFSLEEIDKLWKQNLFIGCNMARGPREQYQKFMTTLFSALMPIWEENKESLLQIKGYDKRAIAFIAERLITGMVLYRDRLFPGMNIATAPIGFIN